MTLKGDDFWKPVITTRQILAGEDQIVVVDLDTEGDWQALGNEAPDDDDLEVVSAEEILALDPSLSSMPDLQPGQTAERDTTAGPWQVVEYED